LVFKLLVAMIAVSLSAFGLAQAAAPPQEAYGRLPAIDSISLSPSGKYMVSVGDVGGKRFILARTLTGDVRMSALADKIKVRDVSWVDDDHVLVTVSLTDYDLWDSGRSEYWRVVSLDIAAGKASMLFANDPRFLSVGYGLVAGFVVDSTPYAFAWNVPKDDLGVGTRLQGGPNAAFVRNWPDLWRINLTTNAIQRVAEGTQNIDDWAVGADGRVVGYANFYETSSAWRLYSGEHELLERKSVKRSTGLGGLGRTPGSMLVFDQSGGVDQWIEVGADGGTQGLWPGENITGILRSPATGLLLGAVVDDARLVFFDPARQARIDAAIKPFHGRITVASTTDAVDKIIVHTEDLGDSGTYYLIDLATHQAVIIDNDYPDVPPDQVGEVRRVTYAAADGLGLDGVLTLPPGRPQKGLPLVVLPHGGPIGPYDRVAFDWIAQAFASRGYAVFQPNYRGSGGRGAAFQDAGYGEYGRKMLSDISDGVGVLAQQGVIDPKRACIVGFSYGGYAALAGVTVQQGLYRCAVSGSGLSDLRLMLSWMRLRYGAFSQTDKQIRLIMGADVAGAPSLESISPAKLAARADAPILLIHGDDDSVVPLEQSQVMAQALKAAGRPVELLVTHGEDHWLSKSETRLATLKAAVAFVQKYNPAD
jgi:dipeptidyl aminopeptidase/acylaminoacyl peptidase